MLRLIIAFSAASTLLYTPVLKRIIAVKNLSVALVIALTPLTGALCLGQVRLLSHLQKIAEHGSLLSFHTCAHLRRTTRAWPRPLTVHRHPSQAPWLRDKQGVMLSCSRILLAAHHMLLFLPFLKHLSLIRNVAVPPMRCLFPSRRLGPDGILAGHVHLASSHQGMGLLH